MEFEYELHFPSEGYILIDYGNRIDDNLNRYILKIADSLKHEALIETIPAYSSILLEYDCSLVRRKEMERLIKETKPVDTGYEPIRHEIKVVYGGDYGPDLRYIARYAGLREDEIIKRHTSGDYRVHMLGFLPGFCYLGGMDETIRVPRLDSPRVKIPAGSVGIAGKQTGIYPVDSPGGWRIIGKTDFRLYRPDEKEVFPIQPGDYIRFTDDRI